MAGRSEEGAEKREVRITRETVFLNPILFPFSI